MRISKIMAEDIANKLVSKLVDQIKKLNKDREKIILIELKSKIPQVIFDLYETYPSYFKRGHSVYIYSDKQCVGHIYPENIPLNNNKLILTKLAARKVFKIDTSIELLKKEKEILVSEIKQTLITLSTHKRILENFPEAHALIPERTYAIAVDIKLIRDKVISINQ